jgi:hypothetical protein
MSTPTLPPIKNLKHKLNAEKAQDHVNKNILLYYDTGKTSESYKLVANFQDESIKNDSNCNRVY